MSEDNSAEVEAGWIASADSDRGAAGKTGRDPASRRDGARVQRGLRRRLYARFGRNPQTLQPIAKSPFYAIEVNLRTFRTGGGRAAQHRVGSAGPRVASRSIVSMRQAVSPDVLKPYQNGHLTEAMICRAAGRNVVQLGAWGAWMLVKTPAMRTTSARRDRSRSTASSWCSRASPDSCRAEIASGAPELRALCCALRFRPRILWWLLRGEAYPGDPVAPLMTRHRSRARFVALAPTAAAAARVAATPGCRAADDARCSAPTAPGLTLNGVSRCGLNAQGPPPGAVQPLQLARSATAPMLRRRDHRAKAAQSVRLRVATRRSSAWHAPVVVTRPARLCREEVIRDAKSTCRGPAALCGSAARAPRLSSGCSRREIRAQSRDRPDATSAGTRRQPRSSRP